MRKPKTKDIRFTTRSESYTFRGTLKEMLKRLGPSFVWICRSAIINIYYIFTINNGMVELNNEKIIFISPMKESVTFLIDVFWLVVNS
ncbi:MAG TPA: hypothetical protein DCW90_20330 [Lachnospiraceae bacterium]|nr:hypothetical protein [Lachnospiraceae bacterium]